MIDVMAALCTILLTARLDYVIAIDVHNIALHCRVHNVLFDKGWLPEHASPLSFYVKLYHVPIAFYSVIL